MTNEDKLAKVQIILGDGSEVPSPESLEVYLELAQNEILNWKYHLVGGVPADVTSVPASLDVIHIYSVVAGFTQAGAEGQALSIENGVHRDFRYADMLDYIHNNVLPYVRVGAVSAT